MRRSYAFRTCWCAETTCFLHTLPDSPTPAVLRRIPPARLLPGDREKPRSTAPRPCCDDTSGTATRSVRTPGKSWDCHSAAPARRAAFVRRTEENPGASRPWGGPPRGTKKEKRRKLLPPPIDKQLCCTYIPSRGTPRPAMDRPDQSLASSPAWPAPQGPRAEGLRIESEREGFLRTFRVFGCGEGPM